MVKQYIRRDEILELYAKIFSILMNVQQFLKNEEIKLVSIVLEKLHLGKIKDTAIS